MLGDPADRAVVERAVRGMWGAAPAAALDELAARDQAIARLAAAYPGIRPIIQADGFTAIVRSISAQQVNLTWAATTRRRLAEHYGARLTLGPRTVYHLQPQRLAEARIEDLRALQFTTRKAEYLIALARGIVDGTFDPPALAALPDAAVIQRLVALRGIGLWTAEWYLARTLDRPVVVAGDLGVRKAVGLVYRDGALPSEQETRALTAHWGAAASLAQELALYALAHSMAAPATLPSATPPLATPGATARRRARPPDASRAPRAPA
jgi:DNA-3-methyladenine glycosylase II